jgi:hypothetical protein
MLSYERLRRDIHRIGERTVMKPSNLDLPVSVKERLLELAKQLPDTMRGSFLSRTADRLADLAAHHSNAIVFAAVGWLLGEIIDHVLTVHVPFSDLALCLTGGKISGIGLVAGALYGLSRDIQEQNIRAEVALIIGEELRRVLGAEGRT